MRRFVPVSLSALASLRLGLAGLMLLAANNALQSASAEGDTRTISFHHVHTGEDITITYKREGRYDDAALKKLDWFMRDWRKEQSTHMDPHLFDLLWEVNREVDGQKPIEVICGYRAPGTNAMLRARSTGVAENSQHIQGHAMDFEIPGVPLEKIRNVGLRLQRGGVGFYPTSGSPFVHMDTGSIRHWPRMTREQLVKVFPDGRTVHVPSDGKPLPGYALALAEVEARGKEPNAVSLAAARNAGVRTARVEAQTDVAEQSAKQPKLNFLASLFGFGRKTQPTDGADDESEAQPASKRGLKPPAMPKPVAVAHFEAPLPKPRPVASVDTFKAGGVWATSVESGALAPVPDLQAFAANTPVAGTTADLMTTSGIGQTALAYAAEPAAQRAARARPMGENMRRAEASVAPVRSTAFAYTVPFTPALSGGVGAAGSPWLRAAMVTPSVSEFMTATPLTQPAMRPLAELMYKPSQSLVMTFSADPNLGAVAESFSGSAVVFLATATFTSQTTASLR